MPINYTGEVFPTGTLPGQNGPIPTRWLGRLDGGHPTIGFFFVGDWTLDCTTPAFWVCTTAGSPGTWQDLSAGGGGGGVTSFNTRTGAVTLLAADLTALMTILSAGSGDLVVSGSTLAPSIDLSSAAKAALVNVASFNTRTGTVTLQAADLTALMTILTAGSSNIVVGGSTLAPTIDLSATAKSDLALAATSLQSLTAGSADVVIAGTGTAPTVDLSSTVKTDLGLAATALQSITGIAAGGALSGTYPNPGIVLDSTAGDIQPVGTQAAGASGKVPDASHVHALNVSGLNLGSDATLSTTTFSTVITTASLAAGTWIFMATATVENSNATASTVECQFVDGSATGSLLVGGGGEAELPALSGGCVVVTLFAFFSISVAGTILFQVKAPGSTANVAKKLTPTTSVAGATSFFAIRAG